MFRATTLRTVLTGAAAVLLMLSLPAEAQWKWKDKSGRVQYSDLPPPAGTPDSDILAKPAIQQPKRAAVAASAASGASAAASTLAPRTVDPDLEAKRKAAESDKNAKGKAEEDRVVNAKADNCNRAKLQLRDLDSGVRISRSNAQGEREFLDDKQRAEETKRAKDTIGTDCK